MFRPLSKLIPVMVTLLVLGNTAASAQNGRITGQVTDPQGKTIPNASVQVVNPEGTFERDTKTDAAGAYSVTGLAAGSYLVVVQAEGFNPFTSDPVTVADGQTLTVNAQITSVKAESSTVVVEGGGGGKIELESATISGTISNQEVTTLGLNGRNFTQLTTTTPGVSNQSGQDEAKVGISGSEVQR